ncbi:MAG: cyclic nucleotide-binding domain-containing protein [Anaerosomatales bacterium]|nr:cyclic nucleotide-binding domain-containing protein [Anaerosomatales bacterium]MDT8434051.1 cyclic nucleotide-binding domain-containing protein [Anaerosomatales bacterium]
MTTDTQMLAGVPLFSRCTTAEIEAVTSRALVNEFETGQLIVSQGTPGTAFYLVLEGRVEVEKDGAHVGGLGPGEFFGEMALLDSAPRSATIRAAEPTRCMMLSSWDFRAALEQHPSVAVKLLEVLTQRLRAADARC